MSTQITTAFVDQYKANVQLLSQQKGSRLRPWVRVETVVGDEAAFEQIDATSAVERTTRHGDTPQIDTPHSRRWVTMRTFDWADLIDQPDQVATLIDPTNAYAQNAAYAMGRQMDDLIIGAAFATAKTGHTSATSTQAFTEAIWGPAALTGNTIVHDATAITGAVGGTSSGLTVNKLVLAKQWFDYRDVDPDIPRIIACNPMSLAALLHEEKATSADYASIKALVAGQIDTFMGFKFIPTTRITKGTSNDIDGDTNVYQDIAFAMDGLCLGVGRDMNARIEERPDKNYSTQVWCSMTMGATRMDEDKVLQIENI